MIRLLVTGRLDRGLDDDRLLGHLQLFGRLGGRRNRDGRGLG
jgi:hypothetical protein